MICEYHETHGHRTEDCRQLREDVARLLKNGHLREFLSEQAKSHYKGRENHKNAEPEEPQHVINRIIGETDTPRGPVMKRTKVSIVRAKRTRDYSPKVSISFNDEDTEGIILPHNDALKEMDLGSEEDDFNVSRSFVLPDDSDATKSTVEELEEIILFVHLPDRKVLLHGEAILGDQGKPLW
ncbi:uncharacterized protein LOC132630959 [Lycium barbarum]|uniref:uncharacterized protein LOC132630959 n=1 Tax=Lycium barbarum TaxID=112863 RepID=UPI00293E061D|nr:uncharacterized protein LOC132630959 [Lycium barbarum]